MAQIHHNAGAIANDGTGDTLRKFAQDVESNETELYNGKVDKDGSKTLSDNNFTDAYKDAIDNLSVVPQVNSDWNKTDLLDKGTILNKPDLTVFATDTDLTAAIDGLKDGVDTTGDTLFKLNEKIDGVAIDFVPYTGAVADVDLGANRLIANSINISLTPTGTPQVGDLYVNADGELSFVFNDGTTLNIGKENWIDVTNKTGVQLNDTKVIYINGAQGNKPTGALAKADSFNTSDVIAVLTMDIANNGIGKATTSGIVHGYNTSGFTAGARLYLSNTTAGELTATIPTTGFVVFVGYALNSTNNGMLLVKTDRPLALDLTSNSSEIAPSVKAVKTAVDLKSKKIKIVIEGDSRSAQVSPTTTFWDTYFKSDCALGKEATIVNKASGGATLSYMASTFTTQILPEAPQADELAYFILIGGANDFGSGANRTSAQAYADFLTLVTSARSAGFIVVASTETGGEFSYDAQQRQYCNEYNALLLADKSVYDYLIPFAETLPTSDTTNYLDGIHFTDLGSKRFAALIAETLTCEPSNLPLYTKLFQNISVLNSINSKYFLANGGITSFKSTNGGLYGYYSGGGGKLTSFADNSGNTSPLTLNGEGLFFQSEDVQVLQIGSSGADFTNQVRGADGTTNTAFITKQQMDTKGFLHYSSFNSLDLNTLNSEGKFSVTSFLASGSSNTFTLTNNANAVITLDTYDGSETLKAQLGFNGDNQVFSRTGNGDWNKFWHSGNFDPTLKANLTGATFTGQVEASSFKTNGYTVATLPTGVIGMCAYVTDALTPTFGNTLVGGGAVVAKAFFNGTNWINE